jgi:hypothetical protein
LSCQPGLKSHIKITDIEYLNLSDKEVRAARQPALKRFPTLEQIREVVSSMPTDRLAAKRGEAVGW